MNNRVHPELNWKATVINEEKRDWGKGLVFDRLMYSNEKRSLRDELSRRVWIYAHLQYLSFLCFLIIIWWVTAAMINKKCVYATAQRFGVSNTFF